MDAGGWAALVLHLTLGMGRAKLPFWYILIKTPGIGVFSPNIFVFEVQIGRIRNLWRSKLIYRPGLNDLSILCSDAKLLFCIFNISLSSDSNALKPTSPSRYAQCLMHSLRGVGLTGRRLLSDSTFDVGRSMFDVHFFSSFPIPPSPFHTSPSLSLAFSHLPTFSSSQLPSFPFPSGA
jgi:hypothetical protein